MSKNLPDIIASKGVSAESYNVIKNVLYPEAKDDHIIALAIDYCKNRNLDIMKKPCHIVPVWDSKRNKYVETIWPGIYEYRTTAARTNAYAGKDEPVFGNDITKTFGKGDNKREYTFPRSCSVTVYRLIAGEKCGFAGQVFWEEAAVFNNKTGLPNAMWSKRTYSQLAKCAEAEALRAAFPDELGGLQTAEEMEGQSINNDMVDITPAGENQTAKFHNRIKEDAGISPKVVVESIKVDLDDQPDDDDSNEWDGKTIQTLTGVMADDSPNYSINSAYNDLRAMLLEIESKKTRIEIINMNLPLIRAFANAKMADKITELHAIADQGK